MDNPKSVRIARARLFVTLWNEHSVISDIELDKSVQAADFLLSIRLPFTSFGIYRKILAII